MNDSTQHALTQLLQTAIKHHHAGEWQEAEKQYLAILQAEPGHPEANHNMGVLSVQQKSAAVSLPYFLAALEADPARGQYWISYIDALNQAGQIDDARQMLGLAQQQGLQSEAVDVLAQRLNGMPVVTSQERPSHQQIDDLVALFSTGRLEAAAGIARQLTARYPQHEFGWKALGAVYKQMGNTADALLPMQKAVALSPNDVEAHFNLGVTLQDLGRFEEAEVSYRHALQINPEYADAHSNLGVTLQNMGRLDEAVSCYRHALKIRPDYAAAHCNLGHVLKEMGRTHEALISYRCAQKLCPDDAQIYYCLGNALKETGEICEAEACYQRAIEISPDNAHVHYNLGNLFLNTGRLAEAQGCYRQAIRINPELADAHYNLGNALREMGRLDEADASFRRTLVIRPDDAEVWSKLGDMAIEAGRLSDAEARYRHVVRISPDFAKAHYNLANVLQKTGRLNDAAVGYQRALQINPAFEEAHYNLGNAFKEMRRLEDAADSYRRAIQINPNFAKAYHNLGVTLMEMGRLVEACASYRHALQIDPDYAEAHCNLGHLLCDLDDLAQAAIEYQKALALAPEKAGLDAAVYLAILFFLDGDIEQCRRLLLTSRPVVARSGSGNENMRSYWLLLDQLVSRHQNLNQENHPLEPLQRLHVIGESHSLCTHGVVVRIKGAPVRCKAEWIPGCKMWHLGNDKINKYKHKFEAVMARLPRASVVLLMIGEIDCRYDEGIMKVVKKYPDKAMAEIMQSTIEAYLNYVALAARRHGHSIIVGGVPAVNIPLNTLAAQDAGQFIHFIRMFNAALRALTRVAGMGFLDVYELTDRGDGVASGAWHIDTHHLEPFAIAQAFEHHYVEGGA